MVDKLVLSVIVGCPLDFADLCPMLCISICNCFKLSC